MRKEYIIERYKDDMQRVRDLMEEIGFDKSIIAAGTLIDRGPRYGDAPELTSVWIRVITLDDPADKHPSYFLSDHPSYFLADVGRRWGSRAIQFDHVDGLFFDLNEDVIIKLLNELQIEVMR